MTKLELQNKIANLEKNISKTKNPTILAVMEKNLKDAKEKLAALEQGTPAPAPSGGSSELEKLYAQREKFKKGLNSSNPVVQKSAKASLPKVEARIAELEGASPAPAPSPAPAKRGRKPKAETPAGEPKKRGRKPKAEAPAGEPKKRGRKPKAETPAEEKPKIRRGRKPKAETPAEVPVAPVRRGRKPKAPTETPAKAPAKRGRPALPKGARSQEVSIDSLTKLGNAIVMFCNENGIESPTLADVKEILYILDKRKALRYAKGGKISKSGSYLSKWQIKQILTDGGMKIGSDEILSGIWLKKKDSDVAQMRMGGGVGYFVIDDDILDSGKSVMLGNRRISAKNKKFQGVFQGKMVGGVMKVYDYDDEMWKAVNPNEWQQAYAEGGEVGNFTLADYKENEETNNHSENALMLVKMYGTQDEIFEVEGLIKKGKREGGFSMEDMRRMYEFSNKYYQYLFIDSMSKASMGEVDIDLSGNYFSTNNFVGKNKLEKEARQVLGRGWKAEDDVSQIQEIVDFLGGGYVVVASYSNQEWDEMYENYYLKNRNNDYLYDIFVISENEFDIE